MTAYDENSWGAAWTSDQPVPVDQMARSRQRALDPFFPRGAWGTMLIALLQAVFLAVFTYFLTGQLELALKDRQATVSAVKEMDKLVDDYLSPSKDVDRDKLARKLAMYGADAVIPLMILAIRSPEDADVALGALRLVALQHRRETCGALDKVGLASRDMQPSRLARIKQLAQELNC